MANQDLTPEQARPATETQATEIFLSGEANPNLLPIAIGNQKYIHLTGGQVRAFVQKCGLRLPERVLEKGVVFIGPESNQHYEIVANGLGIMDDDKEKLKELITSMDIENAGILLNIGGQSILMGVSMSLNHRQNLPIKDIPKEEKKTLDDKTMTFLNEIYGPKWKFIPPVG